MHIFLWHAQLTYPKWSRTSSKSSLILFKLGNLYSSGKSGASHSWPGNSTCTHTDRFLILAMQECSISLWYSWSMRKELNYKQDPLFNHLRFEPISWTVRKTGVTEFRLRKSPCTNTFNSPQFLAGTVSDWRKKDDQINCTQVIQENGMYLFVSIVEGALCSEQGLPLRPEHANICFESHTLDRFTHDQDNMSQLWVSRGGKNENNLKHLLTLLDVEFEGCLWLIGMVIGKTWFVILSNFRFSLTFIEQHTSVAHGSSSEWSWWLTRAL